MGRFIPGAGAALELPVVVGLLAANDDPVSINKSIQLTFAGNPQSATRRTYSGDVTAVGAVGDKVGLTLDTGLYQAETTPAMTTAQLAAALAQACTLGVYDKWVVEFAGGPAAGGETAHLVINGVDYSYAAAGGDLAANVALGIATAAAADPLYNVSRIGASGKVKVEAKTRGPGHTVTASTDDVVFTHTLTHSLTGISANTTWGVFVPAGSTVTAEHVVEGTTTDTVTASTTGTAAFTCPLTQEGYPADHVIVSDGTHQYAYDVQVGDTAAAVATAMIAVMNGVDGYTAGSGGAGVEEVSRNDYTDFSLSDASITPNPASTLSITPATTQPLVPLLASSEGLSLAGSIATAGTAVCRLNAGTSYDLSIWFRDEFNVWTQDAVFGTKTINSDITHAFTIPAGAMRAYAYVHNFVGGADATVILATTN